VHGCTTQTVATPSQPLRATVATCFDRHESVQGPFVKSFCRVGKILKPPEFGGFV
jgi:hypothetical protein